MGLPRGELLDSLRQHLRESDFIHLVRSYEFSRQQLANIAAVIEDSAEGRMLAERGWGYAAIGSLGRMEAESDQSDADIVLLCDSKDAAERDETRIADKAVRESIRQRLRLKVSNGDNLTGPSSVESIAAPNAIGGGGDHVNTLTKRILLLLESRPVTVPEQTDRVRRGILSAFTEAAETTGRHLHSLANDVGRYYRTVCVDYKSRVDFDGKPWGDRNVKLRHRSKYLFFSTMLAMVGSAHVTADPKAEAEDVYRQLCMTPTERLLVALHRAGLNDFEVIARFNAFVGRMAEPPVREALTTVKYDSRKVPGIYLELHENSKELGEAMMRIVKKVPPEWRDHIFRIFLL